jgi:hypothetical protein
MYFNLIYCRQHNGMGPEPLNIELTACNLNIRNPLFEYGQISLSIAEIRRKFIVCFIYIVGTLI